VHVDHLLPIRPLLFLFVTTKLQHGTCFSFFCAKPVKLQIRVAAGLWPPPGTGARLVCRRRGVRRMQSPGGEGGAIGNDALVLSCCWTMDSFPGRRRGGNRRPCCRGCLGAIVLGSTLPAGLRRQGDITGGVDRHRSLQRGPRGAEKRPRELRGREDDLRAPE